MFERNSGNRAVYVKWRGRLAVYAAVVLPVLAVGVFSYLETKKDLTELAFTQKQSTAHLTAITVKEKFDRLKDIGLALATRVQFRRLVQEQKWEAAIQILHHVPKDFPFVERVFLADSTGVLWADTPELQGVRGKSFSHRDWYRGVVEGREPYVSDVYTRAAAPRINVVAIGVPVKGAGGELKGIMVLQVTLNTLFEWSRGIDVGLDGFVYLVDRKGSVAAHPKYAIRDSLVDYSRVPVVQKLMQERQGVGIAYNPVEREERLSAYEPVPGYGWGVVAQQPTRTAFAARDAELRRVLAIYGFVFLLSALAAFLIMRGLEERRQNEQTLRASEERFRSITETAHDAIVMANQEGAIVLWNKGAETIFGYVAEEVMGRPLTILMPERYLDGHRKGLQRFLQTGQARVVGKTAELHGLTKNGREFPLELSLTSWKTEGEVFFSGIIRDISERRRNEERFHKLLEAAPDALVITSEDGRIVLVNAQTEKLFGYEREQLVGMAVEELMPQRFRGKHVGNRMCYAKEPKVRSMGTGLELYGLRRDGTEFPVEISLSPIETEQGRLVTAAIRDISERKRAEEKLRKSEEKYRTLFDSLDVGICTIEVLFDGSNNPVDYRFLEVNSSFEKQTGIQNAVGRRMREIAPLHEEHWFEIYGKIALTGEPKRFENEAAQLSRWYDVYAFRVGEAEKRQVAIHFNDITGRKQGEREIDKLNESLQQHAAQLEAANKELEAFSYSVSHDLRAPLRSIDGFSQALLEDCRDRLDESGKDYLGRVRGACQRMAQLIDDLLNLSRVSRGEMRVERVDLSALSREIVSELQRQAPERKTTFVIADNLISKGDPRLLRVALENLLGNAWKYTSKHPSARIEFGARREPDGKTVFFVRDDGAGFDMAYAGKLFGAFQRLHGPSDFPGTGVGLATVQRIVHRHGGRVWAEGIVEQGAAFYFTL